MLNDLIADIMLDFTDEQGNSLVESDYIERCAIRALPIFSADIKIDYQLDGEVVSPAMSGEYRELWLVLSKIFICRYLRSQSASRVNFSSGDKKMDRSREAQNWALLEKDMRADYLSAVKRINPMMDEKLIVLNSYPVIYKHGSSVD